MEEGIHTDTLLPHVWKPIWQTASESTDTFQHVHPAEKRCQATNNHRFLSKTESGDHSGKITFRNTVLTHYIPLKHIYKDTNTHETFTSYRRIMSPHTECNGHMLIVTFFFPCIYTWLDTLFNLYKLERLWTCGSTHQSSFLHLEF